MVGRNTSRIFLHDFGSYKFILDSVRDLGEIFEHVSYSFSEDISQSESLSLELGPRIDIYPISTGSKYSDQNTILKRLRYEIIYGVKLLKTLISTKSEVVILANTPLIATSLNVFLLRKRCFIFWHQDFLSFLMVDQLPYVFRKILRMPLLKMEEYCLKKSKSIICISESFNPLYLAMGLDMKKVIPVPNWPPKVGELKYESESNDWLAIHGVPREGIRIIYSGRIGKKHDSSIFLDLHRKLLDAGLAHVLVILSNDAMQLGLNDCGCTTHHFHHFPFQEDAIYQNIMGNVDVGLIGLTGSASKYSVPSKALTYLGSGLRVLAFLDTENPITKVIRDYGGFAYLSVEENLQDLYSWISHFEQETEVIHKQAIINQLRQDFRSSENLSKIRNEVLSACAIKA
jgi:hypothetical protein